MNLKYLLPIALGLCVLQSYGAAIQELASSVMATGHWVRIRVHDDAVYQMTYSDLRQLGFDNPERVKVFGYAPTVLLSHDFGQMPVDLSPIYTLHNSDENKLFFYGKGDTDYAPELWREVTDQRSYLHKKHAHSLGATYFLSDADVPAATIGTVAAPESVEGSTVLTSHTSLIYHEEEAVNLSLGGFWFGGRAINSTRPSETHSFTVSKTAGGEAVMVYKSLLANTQDSKFNFLLASYSDGIMSAESTGSSPGSMASYQSFSQSIRFQRLTLPSGNAPATYSVTFSVHPNASAMDGNCALDFYGLRYKRTNDVTGDAQVRMYYENWGNTAFAAIENLTEKWKIWNVNDYSNITEYGALVDGHTSYVELPSASTDYPNQVIAFDMSAQQPSPEIVGAVDNQNLHAMTAPQLVILTSKPLLSVAEKVADFHRRHQNLDVAIVDQQQIFNEFASGNTSPEGVRRFLRHIDMAAPGRLRGLLILGPATYDNAHLVNDDSPYVVTAESEDYSMCPVITKNFATDTFFARFGERKTFDSWVSRIPQLQIFANDIDIAVGRLPFISPSEFDDYYSKAEAYLTKLPTFPAAGNYLMISDYSKANEEHHLTNSEALVQRLGDKAGSTVTVTRAASNLISAANNTILKKVVHSALENGVNVCTYFGHGSAVGIGGSTSSTDYSFDIQSAAKLSTPGRYPLFYIGSCKVAEFDRTNNNLTNSLLSNPNGGAIAVVTSCREVFQPMNEKLGQFLTDELIAASNNDWLGTIWARAQSAAVGVKSLAKDNIANHLDYNFFGDPALPYHGETHTVTIDPIADSHLQMLGTNTVSGSVLNAAGEIDSEFSGFVTLTIYDVPTVAANKLGSSPSGSYPYHASVELDQDVLGRVTGEVRNGRFSVDFICPSSSRSGLHRIQAYAYSTDATSRGLGYVGGIAFDFDPEKTVTPDEAPVAITSFIAEGEPGAVLEDKVMLKATINAPCGLAQTSAGMVNPLRLVVDGNTATNLHRLLNNNSGTEYSLEYVTQQLSSGKHTATLSVLDAAGNWAEESIDFVVNNAPAATITAAVDGTNVNFEISSSIAAIADKRLVIENLNGDLVAESAMTGTSGEVTLDKGAYRAYVQLRTPTAATSTARLHFVVD